MGAELKLLQEDYKRLRECAQKVLQADFDRQVSGSVADLEVALEEMRIELLVTREAV